jgi:hypothetical protein
MLLFNPATVKMIIGTIRKGFQRREKGRWGKAKSRARNRAGRGFFGCFGLELRIYGRRRPEAGRVVCTFSGLMFS